MAPNTLTIAEAHEQLKGKKISSAELTQACIDRIEKVDGTLNATVFRNFERALEEAKKIDTKGEFTHPLSGIPYLTKDVFCEKGVPTTGCSNVLRRKDYIPAFDSTTTKRLKAAGALSLGKTNTDEFTMGASTETSCYGVTRCPWDTKRVAGGSSGGSAAGGMSMASSLDTIGPLCKSIEDIAIVLETIAGKDPLDATTSDVPVPHYRQALSGSIKGMKLGMPKEYFIKGMHKDTEAAVRDTTKVFESAGATVEEISLPHTEYAVPTYYIICPSEVSSNMARYDGIRYGHTTGDAKDLIDYYHRVRTEGFGNEVKRRIMIGTYALSAGYYDAYYRQAQKVRTLIKRDFDEAFRKVDAIIAPVSPTPAFTVGTHENDPVAMYLEDVFSVSQAMAGIPALSVPCGFSKSVTPGFVEGLPIGLQIMGPQWQEERILKIAYAYEQAAEWHERKPKL
ncbi:MAG: Aspartyl-tRNA(Asn) amidotransferase subunit A, Glutamyl-tRNA(Gln) amidotransferase subunit A [Candidatus Peregrinibacteria bacterium GW2011_GWA2_54_9]|nr:MAG: Aspartyl-tRNA(Asn) amidotransferase subunit A, Glutamyl-tRNA(Gln) amidotransferase subunit A [Candidatus Peregrinibacteria bacterium GW2011_GWA2_54_9]